VSENEYVICPFCKEEEFDLAGLKYHFNSLHCEVFNETETLKPRFGAGSDNA